jgi:hypothetical protein
MLFIVFTTASPANENAVKRQADAIPVPAKCKNPVQYGQCVKVCTLKA